MIRDILTRWGFQIDDKKLSDLDHKLEGIKRRMDLLVGVEIAKGLFHIAESFSKVGEEIALGAEAAGISAEEFQKLAYAAKLNNVEVNEMQQGLRVLSKQLYDARSGSQQANKAFQAVGFSPEQVRGFKNSKDALLALSDRFANIQDPIKKAALAQELLGRGGTRMVSLLSKGSKGIKEYGVEAKNLGIILSSGQVEALDRLENTLQKLWAIFKSIGAVVGATLAPAIIYLVDAFGKFVAANRALIQQNIVGFLRELAYGFGFVFGFCEALIIQLMKLAKAFGFQGSIGKLIADMVLLAGAAWAVWKAVQAIVFVWKLFRFVAGIGWIAQLGAAIWGLVPAALAFILPWLPWIAGIAATVVALHDMWALLNGKPTWIGEGFGAIKSALGFGAPAAGPTAAIAGPGAGGGGVKVEAPMTFVVPEGTPMADVGKVVKNAAIEHFEQVMRNTNRSTAPTVAY